MNVALTVSFAALVVAFFALGIWQGIANSKITTAIAQVAAPKIACASCGRSCGDDQDAPMMVDDRVQLVLPHREVAIRYFVCQRCIASALEVPIAAHDA